MMKLQSVIFNMKRDKRALYYKPLALLLTVDLIDNGDIEPRLGFPPELILNKFSEAMLHFDKSRKLVNDALAGYGLDGRRDQV